MTMTRETYPLPSLLTEMIASGVWPTGNPNLQELKPVLGKDAAHGLSSEDNGIVLMPPPFHTIGDEVRGGNRFWKTGVTNPKEIDYDKALIIADFGMGSDSPIVLYYEPKDLARVMYLRWIGNGQNIRHEWVETHRSFDDFAVAVGLSKIHAEQCGEREPPVTRNLNS